MTEAHVEAGMRPWDTVKPLRKHFRDTSRVVLVDDDEYKSVEGERDHMLLVPPFPDDLP